MLTKIINTIKLTTDLYLYKHFNRINEDQKNLAINAYNKDIERLAKYILESDFLKNDTYLSENFIKWLHKNFYPNWYSIKWIDENWNEITWMIPWEYKKIENFVNTKNRSKIFEDIPQRNKDKEEYTKPDDVPNKMKNLIIKFNNDYFWELDIKTKKDIIFLFITDISYTHPFSDWNWRIVSILLDMLLLKTGLNPIWYKTIASKDLIENDKAFFLTFYKRDTSYLYDFIDKFNVIG